MASVPEGEGNLNPYRFGCHIADTSIRRVAPGPAQADVQHTNLVSGLKHHDGLRFRRWYCNERGRNDQVPEQGLGIMRGDDAARQADVGKILPICVGGRIGEAGGAGKRKAINDLRRLAPFLVARLRGACRLRLRGGIF